MVRAEARRRGESGLTDIEQISGDVIDVALRLHRELGSGLLESVYEVILASKLSAMGYSVARQRPIDIEFDGLRFEAAFRIGRAPHCRSWQAVPDVFASDQTARRAAHQLWWRNPQGRLPPPGQRLPTLCVSASLREFARLSLRIAAR